MISAANWWTGRIPCRLASPIRHYELLRGVRFIAAIALLIGPCGAQADRALDRLAASDALQPQDVATLASASDETLWRWTNALPGFRAREQARFVRKLEVISDQKRVVPLLAQILHSGAPPARTNAAAGLVRIGSAACPHLIASLNDLASSDAVESDDSLEEDEEYSTVTGRAAWVLANMDEDCGDRLAVWFSSIAAGVQDIEEEDGEAGPGLAARLAAVVWSERGAASLPMLTRLAQQVGTPVQQVAVSAMLSMPRTPALRAELADLVTDAAPDHAFAIAASLLDGESEVSGPRVRAWAGTHADSRVRALSLLNVSHSFAPSHLDPLVLGRLADKDRRVRAAALSKLAMQPLASRWLLEWLEHENDWGLTAFTIARMPDSEPLAAWLVGHIVPGPASTFSDEAGGRLCEFSQLPASAELKLATLLPLLPLATRNCLLAHMVARLDKTPVRGMERDLWEQLQATAPDGDGSIRTQILCARLLLELGQSSDALPGYIVSRATRLTDEGNVAAAAQFFQLIAKFGLLDPRQEMLLLERLEREVKLDDLLDVVDAIRASRLGPHAKRARMLALLKSGVTQKRLAADAANSKRIVTTASMHQLAVLALVRAIISTEAGDSGELVDVLASHRASLFPEETCKALRYAQAGVDAQVELAWPDVAGHLTPRTLLRGSGCEARAPVRNHVDVRSFVRAFRRALTAADADPTTTDDGSSRQVVLANFVSIAAGRATNLRELLFAMLEVLENDRALAWNLVDETVELDPSALGIMIERASFRSLAEVTSVLADLDEDVISTETVRAHADAIMKRLARNPRKLRQWIDNDPDAVDGLLSELFDLNSSDSRCAIDQRLVDAVVGRGTPELRLTMIEELAERRCANRGLRSSLEASLDDEDADVSVAAAEALIALVPESHLWDRAVAILTERAIEDEMMLTSDSIEFHEFFYTNAEAEWPLSLLSDIGSPIRIPRRDWVDRMTLDAVEVTSVRLEAGPNLPGGFWPPPKVAALGRFGRDLDLVLLGSPGDPLSIVQDRLVRALHDVDENFDSSLFAAPGGFALLAKTEQTNSRGEPLDEANRWKRTLPPPSSMREFLTRVLVAPPGNYRTIAFVFTDQNVIRGEPRELPDISLGARELPPEIGDIQLKERNAFVLVFAFVRRDGWLPKIQSELSARVHLERAGISEKLRSSTRALSR